MFRGREHLVLDQSRIQIDAIRRVKPLLESVGKSEELGARGDHAFGPERLDVGRRHQPRGKLGVFHLELVGLQPLEPLATAFLRLAGEGLLHPTSSTGMPCSCHSVSVRSDIPRMSASWRLLTITAPPPLTSTMAPGKEVPSELVPTKIPRAAHA